MSAVRIVVKHKAVRALLRGDVGRVRAVVASMTEAVQESAEAQAPGADFQAEVTVGKDRVRGAVWTHDHAARVAQAKHRVLDRAFEAARR